MSVVANVAINVDSSGAVSKLRQVQTQAQQTEKAFGALQSAIGALGVGFALTKVIADVKELDTNLRRLGTVGVDVAKISPALSKLSDELGGVASKAELAAASYQAASAGFSDTAGNINILRAATKAATGGLADTQAVTEVLVKTLNSYGMSGDQAIQVTDSISKAVELGNQEWSDYTSQLGRVASIAALAGVSLDEVNAFIAAATKNGATAEIAFTGLSATLNTLLQPTKESQEAAAKLGIAWNYGGLQAKGFTGLMAELAVAIDKDKEASARLLGTQEAMRGAFAAASKDGSDFKTILEQIGGAAGKTDADFQTMKGSLENTLKALDTSFKNLSEALGTAFGPTVVIAVQDITKAVNSFADFMATVPQPVMDTAGALVKLIAQMLLLQKAIQAIIALRAAFIGAMAGMTGATVASGAAATTSASAFALYTANARTLQATSIAATASVSGLAGALLGLAGIGIITVGINYVITQTGAILGSSTAAGKSEAAGTAGGLAAQLKGKSAAERKQMLAAAQKNLANDRKLASTLSLQIKAQESAMTMPGEGPLPSDRSRLTEIQARINTNQARIKAIQTAPVVASQAPLPNAMGTPIGATVGDGASGKKKGKTDAEREAERAEKDAKRVAEQIAQQKSAAAELLAIETGRLTIATTAEPLQQKITAAIVRQADIQREYNQKLKESQSAEETLSLQLAQRNAIGVNALELQQALTQEVDSLTEPLQSIFDESKARLELENRYQKLLTDGVNPELAKEFAQLELTAEKQTQLLALRLGELEAAKAKLSAESAVALALQDQIDKIKEILKLQGAAVDASKQETEEERKRRIEREEKEKKEKDKAQQLKNLYDGIASTIEDGIVASIQTGIDGLINGTKDLDDALKEILSGVLKEIANMLIKFAVRSAFGALGFADGGVFAGNRVQPFARGGVVNQPTLFPFADGGAMRTGLMGEAGPEAIMPLKRGPDGSLGVQANGLREAMGRQQGGASGSPVLNMSFESTTIGGVEYVSRDQLEQAMAETKRSASRDGAQRGMTMTLDRIQNSSSTRRRVGI